MTRTAIFGVFLLGIATCTRGSKSRTCDQVNERMRMLERQPGRLDEALRLAGGFLDRRGADSQSVCYWSLYLHRAEVVLANKGAEPALALLKRRIPAGVSTPELEATREMLLGGAQSQLSHYPEALQHLGAAYDWAPASAPKLMFAIEAWRNDVCDAVGDHACVERSLQHLDEAAARLGDRSKQIYLYAIRGHNLEQAGRFEGAVELFEKALSLAEEQEDEALIAEALLNLGWCYHELGDLDKAQRLLGRALAIDRRLGQPAEAQKCLGDLGVIYLDRGDPEKATASYLEALALARENNDLKSASLWLSNLASISIDKQDWTAAQTYNDQALTSKRELQLKDAELISRVNAALIENGRGDRAKAIEIFNGVLQAGSSDPRPNIGAHVGLADIYEKNGDWRKAEAEYEQALLVIDGHRAELIKDSSKLSYGSNLTSIESSYVSLLMRENKSERALEVTEDRRARLLNERLGAKQRGPLAAADYRKVARASGRILISYFLGPERSFVWVVLPDRIEARVLAREAKIKRLVESYRALIEDQENPLDTDSRLGEDLYRELLAPVSNLIPQGSRVVLVPHGSLHALNMETLIAPSPAPHYWGDDVMISVAPSLNVLSAGVKRTAQPPSLLLIGDPIAVDREYPKLRFAAPEIEAVQQYFQPARRRIFRGSDAAPAAYLGSHPENFSMIHFTAHGTADRESPLDSAIILSGSERNYRLTATDVLSAKLSADLVVISACRSAGARTYAGEGLVGFTWAFFRAGAGNVIAGLWDVSDESTPQLMDQLYRSLAQGVAPDRALRAAKQSLMHSSPRYRAPYYWAPFQLYARRLI